MKKFPKFLALIVAAVMLFAVAAPSNLLAFSVSIDSEKHYTDSRGNAKKEVSGTLTFDSDYPCNTTTGRCGEDLPPYLLGLSDVDWMAIEPGVLPGGASSGGAFFFKYHGTGTSGSGGTAGNVRAYYYDNTGLGPLASAPTYDLSTMQAVPFRAIGSI